MRGHRISELRVVVDLLDDADHLRRHLLVELHIALEFGDDGPRHRLGLDALALIVGKHLGVGFIIVGTVGVLAHLGALDALDQHLDGAIGQLEQLQDAGERTDLVDRVRRRIVVRRVLLRRQQDIGIGPHHLFQRLDRLFTADEERNDHVRKDHDVAQRQNRIGPIFAGLQRSAWFCSGHNPSSLCCAPHLRPASGAVDMCNEMDRMMVGEPAPLPRITPGIARTWYASTFRTPHVGRSAISPWQWAVLSPGSGTRARSARTKQAAANGAASCAARRNHRSQPTEIRRWRRRPRPSRDRNGPRRCRAAAPSHRRLPSTARPLPRLRGSAGRTSCRAGCFP